MTMEHSKPLRITTFPFYMLYFWTVIVLGVSILITQLPSVVGLFSNFTFLLLVLFIIIVQFTTSSLPVSDEASVTYSVSSAIGVASIPLFGTQGIIFLEVIGAVYLWIAKRNDAESRKLSHLAFNLSMAIILGFITAVTYRTLTDLLVSGTETLLSSYVLPVLIWIVTAVVYDQINQWLVFAIIKLQHGKKIDLLQMWRENRWASFLAICFITIGGGSLAIAIDLLDWLGVTVFFLPILATSYAFTIYAAKTKQQMGNLETIIAERTQELAQLNAEKDAFLALLTHDMKSPLTSIGIYAEMLRRKPELLQRKPHTLDNILRAHGSLTDIVNNIVDLEKLQAGNTLALDWSQFNLGDLTEYVVELMLPQAEQKQIELSFQLPDVPTFIRGDRLQIERVLTNLVSNALKYTAERGAVRIQIWRTEREVNVTVRDTGYGIPADELPYIFDRYRRVTKHKDKAVGTGLGLAIAKAIANAHGGELSAESTESIGSTFTLSLPSEA